MSIPFFQHTLSSQFPDLVIPKGSLFYPCCGDDLWEPIRLFADVIDECHFVDMHCFPQLPPLECLGKTEKPGRIDEHRPFIPKEIVYQVSKPVAKLRYLNDSTLETLVRLKGTQWKHVGDSKKWRDGKWRITRPKIVERHLTFACEPPRTISVFRYRQDGLAYLLELEKIAVFFYRGDSNAEGGSALMWGRTKLFDLILEKLMVGGLIVTDGSNDLMSDGRHNNGQGKDFSYAGRAFKCFGVCSERKRRPVYVWQVRNSPQIKSPNLSF